MELFPKNKIIGIFRGFQPRDLEFHADLVFPYKAEFQNIPMHGQFVLVQLETNDEALLGRIGAFTSEGKLSYGGGEEFNIRAVQEDRPIPEDLREQYLRYRVMIRILGILRNTPNGLVFVPSHRRLPHVGSKVAFPSDEVVKEIAGHNTQGAPLGHLAYGEYVFCGSQETNHQQPWLIKKDPEIIVRFPIESLVARRSLIFARAGFGKSNLNKLLFSELYRQTPTIRKRGGRAAPVGTIIFDPDGEYFWPDDKGRPGLCDVPHLEDKLVVFTKRQGPSSFYDSFVACNVRLDLRDFPPAHVISIAIDPERQEQQNVRKLKGLSPQRWSKLVELIEREGHGASLEEIAHILDLDPGRQEAEALAARANMATIVKLLHDSSSQFLHMLVTSLREGKLCIVDLSQMRGSQGFILASLILNYIFTLNQDEFTKADPETIPTVAVIEEAQSVLRENTSASEPFIAWIKEGRKYDLGAILITQQPGSIPTEILSQGDNWFVFHLLSAVDLYALKKANAHFSDDLLSSLLNEPIPGHGVFWSSAGKPYPLSVRVLSFESLYQPRDPSFCLPKAQTFAEELKLRPTFNIQPQETPSSGPVGPASPQEPKKVQDKRAIIEEEAIDHFCKSELAEKLLKGEKVRWGEIKTFHKNYIAKRYSDIANLDKFCYDLVRPSLDRLKDIHHIIWGTVIEEGKTKVYFKSAVDK